MEDGKNPPPRPSKPPTSRPKATPTPSPGSSPIPGSPLSGVIPTSPPSAVSPSASGSVDEEKRLRLREKAAKEILETEKSYVKSLLTLVEVYGKPMGDLAKLSDSPITPEEVDILFSEMNSIIQLNQKFCEKIEQRVKDWNNETTLLADIFLEYAPYFKMYTQYVTNHDKATKVLLRLNENQKFFSFMLGREQDPRGEGHQLNAFLIMPIQRIPRYRLLLQEFIKYTLEKHPDYQKLKQALVEIGRVADHVNEGVAMYQRQAELVRIQRQFAGADLVAPGRNFIFEGPMTVKAHNGDMKVEFFLFNDLFLYAQRGVTGVYKVKFSCKLNKAFQFQDLEDKPDLHHCIYIINPISSFIVEAPDAASKQLWLTHLQSTLEDATQKNSKLSEGHQRRKSSHYEAAPIWQSDLSSKSCAVCNKVWTILRRRHHCRSCGSLVCDACSQKKLQLESRQHKEAQRVCDKCVITITKREERKAKEAKKDEVVSPVEVPVPHIEVPPHIGGHKRVGSQLSDAQIAQLNDLSDEEDDPDELIAAASAPTSSSPLGASTEAPKKKKVRKFGGVRAARALWSFDSKDPQDLTFHEGDIIKVLSSQGAWWRGHLKEKVEKLGLFPGSYVELLPEEATATAESHKPTTGTKAPPPPVPPRPFASVPTLPTTPPPPLPPFHHSSSTTSTTTTSSTTSTATTTTPMSPSPKHERQSSQGKAEDDVIKLKKEIELLKSQLDVMTAQDAMIKGQFQKCQDQVLELEKEKRSLEEKVASGTRTGEMDKILSDRNKKIEELEKKLMEKNKTGGDQDAKKLIDQVEEYKKRAEEAEAREKELRKLLGDKEPDDLRKENAKLKLQLEESGSEDPYAKTLRIENEKLKTIVQTGSKSTIEILMHAIKKLKDDTSWDDEPEEEDDDDLEFLATPISTPSSSPRNSTGPPRSSIASPAKSPSKAVSGASGWPPKKDKDDLVAKALGNFSPASPVASGARKMGRDEDWEADAAYLSKGSLITKLPRWGKPRQVMFYLVKRSKKRAVVKRGSIVGAQFPKGQGGDFKMPMPETPPEKETLSGVGDDEEKDDSVIVYCLEWSSSKGQSRIPLTNEIQISFGQKSGQFLKSKYRKQFQEYERRSFTLFTRDRTLDLMVNDPEDFQRWLRVLKHLFSEKA